MIGAYVLGLPIPLGLEFLDQRPLGVPGGPLSEALLGFDVEELENLAFEGFRQDVLLVVFRSERPPGSLRT